MKTKPQKHKIETNYLFIIPIFLIIIVVVGAKIINTTFIEGDEWRKVAENIAPKRYRPAIPTRGTIYASNGEPMSLTMTNYRLYFDYNAEVLRPLIGDSVSWAKIERINNDKHKSETQKKKEIDRIRARFIRKDSLSKCLDQLLQVIKTSYGDKYSTDYAKLRRRWDEDRLKRRGYSMLFPFEFNYLELINIEDSAPLVYFKERKLKDGSIRQTKHRSKMRGALIKEPRMVRTKPYGSLARMTIGDVQVTTENNVSKGLYGMEQYYDSLLCGTPGKIVYQRVGGRTRSNTFERPIDGANIYTTIDATLQQICDNALRDRLSQLDVQFGEVILMEVNTGRIVAVSNLDKSENGTIYERKNHAFIDLIEPGSVFKTAVMAAALDYGYVQPEDSIEIYGGQMRIRGGRLIHDWFEHKPWRMQKVSIPEILWYSSNVGMVQIALNHFEDRPKELLSKLNDFGFNENYQIPNLLSETSKIYRPEDQPGVWYGGTLASMSFGLGLSTTALHMVNFYSTIANGGTLYRPYLVDKIVDQDGKTIESFKPEVLRKDVLKKQTIEDLHDILRGVVTGAQHCTGKNAESNIVAISGKTGTSNLLVNGRYVTNGPVNASFCCYFPSDKPEYAAIIHMRTVHRGGGGSYCAPVAKRIAEEIYKFSNPVLLDTMTNIEPTKLPNISGGTGQEVVEFLEKHSHQFSVADDFDKQAPAKVKKNGDELVVVNTPKVANNIMPSVIGTSLEEALYQLKVRGLRVRIEGQGHVVRQSISYGQKIQRGQSVTITLAN